MHTFFNHAVTKIPFFKKRNSLLVFTLAFLLLFSLASYALAAARAQPYTPGATNDPTDCNPGETNCFVNPISPLTAGGVAFTSSTGSLTQDNASLFFDDTTNALGIGTASPAATSILDLTSTTKGFLPPRMTTVQKDAIASPATGLTIYDTTLGKLNVYNGSAWKNVGSAEIGGEVTSATEGSVFFAGASGVLAQDNASLFFDDASNELGIGTATPGAKTHIVATTEQLRVGYDVSNYVSTTVGSTGVVTFNVVGTAPGMTLTSSTETQVKFIGAPNETKRILLGDTTYNNVLAIRTYGDAGTNRYSVIGQNFTEAGAVYDGTKQGSAIAFDDRVGLLPIRFMYKPAAGSSTGAGGIDNTGNWAVGTDFVPSAQMEIRKITEQLRVGYDASNYYSTTVGSTGAVVFDGVGAGTGFRFSDNVGIGTAPSGSYGLDINSALRLNGIQYFATTDIRINNANTVMGNVIIGDNTNAVGASGNRSVIVGTGNNFASVETAYTIGIGYANSATGTFAGGLAIGTFNSVQSQYCKVIGDSNTGSGCQHSIIFGRGNTYNNAATTTEGGGFIIGNANSITHLYSSILGTSQATTANNQLILGHQSGTTSDGYNDVYFGTGPVRLTVSQAYMNTVTLNGSGASTTADMTGGSIRLAGGLGVGAGNGGDVYIATSSVLASGTTRQSLTNRMIVEYDTGDVGIGDLTPSYRLEIADDTADYVTNIFNDGNAATRSGLRIQAGLDDHTAAGPSTLIGFFDGDGGAVGSITFGSSATAYNTTSDQRLKENVVDSTDGLALLNQIQVRDYSFIADSSHNMYQGFIAQELEQIYPRAVTKPVDEMTGYWMVDYSKLMPLAIQAIQDLDIKIQELDPNTNTSFATRIVTFLGSASNGVQTLFADKVQTKELCIEEVCVTKAQLQQLLNQGGTSSSGTVSGGSTSSTSGTTTGDTSTDSGSTDTTGTTSGDTGTTTGTETGSEDTGGTGDTGTTDGGTGDTTGTGGEGETTG